MFSAMQSWQFWSTRERISKDIKVQLIIIAKSLVHSIVLGPFWSPDSPSTAREAGRWWWGGCSTVVGRWLSFIELVSLGVAWQNSSWVAGIWVCSMDSGPSKSSGACSSTWSTGLDCWMTSSSGFGSFLKKELLWVTSFWSVVLLAVIIDPLTFRIVYGTGLKRGLFFFNSLLNESVISDVQAVRLGLTFEASVGPHTSLCFLVLLHGSSLVLSVRFMHNL